MRSQVLTSDIIRTLSGLGKKEFDVYALDVFHHVSIRLVSQSPVGRPSWMDLYFSKPRASVCVCVSPLLQISEFTHRVGAEALQLLAESLGRLPPKASPQPGSWE